MLDDEIIEDDGIIEDDELNNKTKENLKKEEDKKVPKKKKSFDIDEMKQKITNSISKAPKVLKIGVGAIFASVLLAKGYYTYLSSSIGKVPDINLNAPQQQVQNNAPQQQTANQSKQPIQQQTQNIGQEQKNKIQKTRDINNINVFKNPPKNKKSSTKIQKVEFLKKTEIKNIQTKINKKDPIINHIASNITNIPQKLDDKNLFTLNSEKLIENKNYEKYLQSKIQLMQKLSLYYKKTAELKKTLDLYKQVLHPQQQVQPKQQNQMSNQLKNTLSSLQQEIISLKQQVAQKKQEKAPQINIVNNTQSLGINSMNVYQKDGRYIVVAKTKSGDKILQVGDMYNNSKIIGITPTTITFQKGDQRFYYNTTPSFSTNYQTANIKLAKSISTTSLKKNTTTKERYKTKKYKQETPQDRLQMLLLQQRNQ